MEGGGGRWGQVYGFEESQLKESSPGHVLSLGVVGLLQTDSGVA